MGDDPPGRRYPFLGCIEVGQGIADRRDECGLIVPAVRGSIGLGESFGFDAPYALAGCRIVAQRGPAPAERVPPNAIEHFKSKDNELSGFNGDRRGSEAKALGIKMGAPYFLIREMCQRQGVRVFSSN